MSDRIIRDEQFVGKLAKFWKQWYTPTGKTPQEPSSEDASLLDPAKVFSPELVADITYIPINAEVKAASVPLPVLLLEEIIGHSTYRVITKSCTCRHAWDCRAYDKNIGCLHIGQATEEEPSTVATSVSVEEAIAHVRKAVSLGLIPFIGRTEGDNEIWGITPGRDFITVCFCCQCCCIMLNTFKLRPLESREGWASIKGVSVNLNKDKCNGCGTCADKCITGAVTMKDGKADIDYSVCKVCGRCAYLCMREAIEVNVEDLDYAVNSLLNRLNAKVGGFNMPEGFTSKNYL
jgi:UDP-glucose 4-epimerase